MMSKADPATVLSQDQEVAVDQRIMPLTLILDNLRSAFNVGNIFRLAEAMRVQEIVCCGYTAMPPHPKLGKTARGCDLLVPCRQSATARQAVREMRERNSQILAVETVLGGASVWEWEAVFPITLVFGNEALGIAEEVLRECHGTIALPVYGRKNSINVGNCAAVVMYEARRQWELADDCSQ